MQVVIGGRLRLPRHATWPTQLAGRGHDGHPPGTPRRRPARRTSPAWDPRAGRRSTRACVEAADVVVNLAGTPTARQPALAEVGRATCARAGSTTTRLLAEAIAGSDRQPAFLAGNGIGWYGDHGDRGRHRGRRQPRATPC